MNNIDMMFDRVKKASQAKSKDIRFTIEEATSIVAEIGLLISKNSKLLEEQNKTSSNIKVDFDGGGFG